MVSTITPALVELLANTLNSLEWEFSDFGQLVDKENSEADECRVPFLWGDMR